MWSGGGVKVEESEKSQAEIGWRKIAKRKLMYRLKKKIVE